MATKTRKVPGTKLVYKKGEEPGRAAPGQYGEIRLYAGSHYQEFGAELAKCLGITLCKTDVRKFSNENIFVRLKTSVRGQDVYFVQGMSSPVSDNIMEMLITIDALKRDSAGRITVVMPYYAYGRSDKKDQPRVPITARLLADMIQVAGADRYIAVDLHAPQIQGFFSIPGDALSTVHLISDYFYDKHLRNAVVVSTDLGFAKKGRNYAAKLDVPLAVVEKRRNPEDGNAEVLSLIGDVKGKDAIIIDDECDTAGSLEKAHEIVFKGGAREIYIAFSHAVLSSSAVDRLRKLRVREIVTTNTLPIPPDKKLHNMKVLSIAPMLAEVLRRTHEGRSVGELFNE